ncbi:hypothetical protein ACXZ65_19480 [Streptomyces aculeolatus]
MRGLLLDVHDAVYADNPDPFHSRERFSYFLDLWSSRKNRQCVVGREGGDAMGYAYGALLAPGGWVVEGEWGYRSVDEYDVGGGSPSYTVMVKRLSGGR